MKLSLIASLLLFTSTAYSQLPEYYQSLTPSEKQTHLWNNLQASEYAKLPPIPDGGWGSIFSKLKSLLTLKETFDVFSDEMPTSRGKNKLLHPSGAVAKIIYVPSKEPLYTGIFATGAIGLARLSLAGNPQSLGSYTPGTAIKLLIKNRPSVNLAVMYSLNGQGKDHNFFAHDFSNRIPEPEGFTLKLLGKWFALFVKNPLVLSVDHFAQLSPEGDVISNIRVPYQLIFQPNQQLKINPNSTNDFRADLAKIPASSLLYTVNASAYEGGAMKTIGSIYTTSRLISSEYGDHQLFFQHHE